MKRLFTKLLNRFKKLFLKFRKREIFPGEVPKEYIASFLPKNPLIIEAGAHVGLDTIEMSKFWPKAKIHAFEPVPHIYDKLKDNTKGCKNVTCYELALSDHSGTAKLFMSSGDSDASSSLLKPKEHLSLHPTVLFRDEVEIKTITLNDWAVSNNIKNIDFLWLDLQGLELHVLKKSDVILKTVKAIMTEVSLVENYAGGALYPELKSWLESNGFKVQREEIAWSDGGNVFFVRDNDVH